MPDASLAPVDHLDVHILVDNVTDSLSSAPSHIETEFAYLQRKGMRVLAGKCICCASHGLSCLITATRGAARHTVLFDTGPDGSVFTGNVDKLGVDLGLVDSMVLSHGHWDHAGGMLRAIAMVRERNGGRTVPYYAHPDMFRPRARQLRDGSFLPMDNVPSRDELAQAGAHVVESRAPQSLHDNMFVVSGEIPRVTSYETGLPFHYQRTPDGEDWQADPWIIDERWLGVNVAGKGLVVFTACSHAGVVNVLTHARALFPGVPVHTVLGGLHLSGATEANIPQTVAGLGDFGLTTVAAGHCTGWRAMSALVAHFGDEVVTPLAVGKRFFILRATALR